MALADKIVAIVGKMQRVYTNLNSEVRMQMILFPGQPFFIEVSAPAKELSSGLVSPDACIDWLDSLGGSRQNAEREAKIKRLAALEAKNTLVDAEIAQLKADLGIV